MGCFMACFGLSNKRKRRKTLYKVLAGNQKYGNYEVLAITEKSVVPYSNFRERDQHKEQKGVKSKKKKVTFNLNVQIYEPNPTAYQVLDNDEEDEEKEDITAESEGRSSPSTRYPSNYRYYNCTDGYDEEDDIVYEESDIDDCDDDEYDWDDDGSDESLENDEAEVYDGNSKQNPSVAEERIENQNLHATNMHSVLIPVENLTQWKAIKAKIKSSKQMMKENYPSEQNATSKHFSPCNLESNALQSKPLLPEIAVDASLSNWLLSPSYNVSTTTIHCQ